MFANGFDASDEPPSARTCHSCCKLDENTLAVYGGNTSADKEELADDTLHILMLDQLNKGSWGVVDITPQSATPGKRFGHSTVFMDKYLVVFAGQNESTFLNDIWLLDMSGPIFSWMCMPEENSPSPRAFHSTVLCEDGNSKG